MDAKSRVVIVGGGISGLALAYRLQQLAAWQAITVLEARSQVGGNVGTLREGGYRIETGPNGFLDNNPATLRLCRDLGLADRLIPASESSGRNRFVFLNGRLRALPRGLGEFLTTDLLSWRGKFEMLCEPFRRRVRPRRDESVAEFARRRAGRETAEVFVDALVTGIHGGDPALLSAAAAFPRLVAMEEAAGSIVGGMIASRKQKRIEAAARGEPPPSPQKMWSFREGLGLLIETLSAQLPGIIHTGQAVQTIHRQGDFWCIRTTGGEWQAETLVLACPAPVTARLLAPLDESLSRQLREIAYTPIAVVALGYAAAHVARTPDGFGYIAPQRTRRDLLGVQWCSAIFPERAPAGYVLWRALCGGWNRPDVVNWDDTQLIAAVRQELRLAQGVTAEPVMARVIRWPQAIPQYHVGHLARVQRIEAGLVRWPGLRLAGNAYHGVAMNDCTEQAERLAREITAARKG